MTTKERYDAIVIGSGQAGWKKKAPIEPYTALEIGTLV
jgi:hypothetical protein